tara:strand:+ start:184 stop:480 length:297 start_codon:yes stop_codon:yes gene_type:complete
MAQEMDSSRQSRICDCWLDVGQCECKITNKENEGKRVNSNKKSSKKRSGDATSNLKSTTEPERPLDWDARDLKTHGWVPKSSRSTEGRYTGRFWEEEE